VRHWIGVLLFSASAIPSAAPSQQLSAAPLIVPGNAVLTVSGEGKVLQAPDVALFTAGVTTPAKPQPKH
jgi:uncharacterized protein YggE